MADEWVILDPRSSELHVLNLSAALLWEQLDGQQTPLQLAEAVWTAFGKEPPLEGVRQEVVTSLADFQRRGLLA